MEQAMNSKRKASFGVSKAGPISILALAAVFAVATGIRANTKPKPTEVPAEVIAHLPLASPPGNQMVLQAVGEKHYLYIQQAGRQGYMIVDVSKPAFPAFINRQAKANDSTAGDLQLVGPNLGIAEVPDKSAKGAIQSAGSPTETVKILDLTDPAHPKTLQTFRNVTSILGDAGRGIIYLANDEGLWVLKHRHAALVPAKAKRPCTSEDALAAMPPDCE
jgi:hypothetical protein